MQESEEFFPEKTISDLPDEILLNIFSYLQTADIKYCVPNVCEQWSVLSKDKRIWRNLNFRTTNRATKTFGPKSWFTTLRFLCNTPQVQSVTITQGHTEEEVFEILETLDEFCPNLKHLTFDTDMTFVAGHLQNFCNLMENLESVELQLDHSPNQAFVFGTLMRLKKLKKVVFLGAEPEVHGFNAFICNSPTLQHLNAERISFTKENFMSLLKEKDKFVTLGINCDKLDEECVKLMRTFPGVVELALSDGNCSSAKLRKMGELNNLTYLYLQEAASSPVLTSNALTKFFSGGYFPNLKELKLHKSRLNDEGALEIRRNCPKLGYLEIMTYPRCLSSMTEKALLHFLHIEKLRHCEILFDNSQEVDWVYRRMRFVPHDCDINEECPLGLDGLLESWDEIQIPVD